MNKFKMIDTVQTSALTPTQKQLLVYLICKSDESGESWPSVAKLCQVAGIAHEKNFKGIDTYLPGLVSIKRVGRSNHYLLDTPSIEGLSQKVVVLKVTPSRANTPSDAGVSQENTPSTAGVSEVVNTPSNAADTPSGADNTPSHAGVNTPSTEGTDTTSDTTKKLQEKLQEDSQAHPPFVQDKEEARVSISSSLKDRCDSYLFDKYGPGTGLDRDELDRVHTLTSTAAWGRKTIQEALEIVFEERSKSWDQW